MEYLKELDIIFQLKESLNCETEELEGIINLLNMTEYWVENNMLNLCEDNDVMRKVLKESFNKFMDKHGMLGGL